MTRENVINNKNYCQKKKYMHNKINKLPIRTKPKNKKSEIAFNYTSGRAQRKGVDQNLVVVVVDYQLRCVK